MKKITIVLIVVFLIIMFAGCSNGVPKVEVSSIVEQIKNQMAEDMKEAGILEENLKDGQLPGFMITDLTAEDTDPLFNYEINKGDIEQGYIIQQMMNVKSDLIIVLKADDKTKLDSLEKKLEEIKENQIGIWEQYLPDQYEKVKNNIIKSKGNYLLYVTYENPEEIEEIFDNLLKN